MNATLPAMPAGARTAPARLVLAALLVPLLLIAAPPPARAAEDDARLWLLTTASLPLYGRLGATLHLQQRYSNDIGDFERLVVRPSLDLALGPALTASLGYDAHWIETPRDSIEHRVWQEITARAELDATRAMLRLRIEQRLLEARDGAAVRLRALLHFEHPFPFDALRRWHLALANELLLNLNSLRGGPQSGFGENRLFIGAGRPLGRGVRVEAGYQAQFAERAGRDLTAHTLLVSFSWKPVR